jgi:carboxymethylenebutenolidase
MTGGIEDVWDRHLASEFQAHDVDATMATMVDDPYLLHVPVLTGGRGREAVQRFYREHFIPKIPADCQIRPVSRTVGVDQIVDELVITFTHDVTIDFLLPGVPPTGRFVEVPTIALGGFDGGKLQFEHVYWDQASVLAQVGLLDPASLPIAGAEPARKLLDDAGPFNTLIGVTRRS